MLKQAEIDLGKEVLKAFSSGASEPKSLSTRDVLFALQRRGIYPPELAIRDAIAALCDRSELEEVSLKTGCIGDEWVQAIRKYRRARN